MIFLPLLRNAVMAVFCGARPGAGEVGVTGEKNKRLLW